MNRTSTMKFLRLMGFDWFDIHAIMYTVPQHIGLPFYRTKADSETTMLFEITCKYYDHIKDDGDFVIIVS